MHYIIDANNLAGVLGILFEDDFDEKLVGIIKDYNKGKSKKISLVFDSADNMGDKYSIGNIDVIYTPRDNYYKSADDKIIELLKNICENLKNKDEVVVITDDIELRELAKKASEKNRNVYFQKATDFAIKLNKNLYSQGYGDEKINDDEIKKINDDLLRLWT
ncbi:MAG: NYN domain-containing protein [bacterium]